MSSKKAKTTGKDIAKRDNSKNNNSGNNGQSNRGSDNKGCRNNNDKKNKNGGSGSNAGGFYDEFMPLSEVNQGLASGTLYSGVLRVLAQKRRTAFVSVKGAKNDVQIEGEKDRNRCVDGDEVVLQLLPEEEWPEKPDSAVSTELLAEASLPVPEDRASTTVRPSLWCPDASLMAAFGDKTAPVQELPAHGDAVAHPIDFACRPRARTGAAGGDRCLQPRAKVVYVLKRAHKLTTIGELQLPASYTGTAAKPTRLPESEARLFFHALDKRYPHILVQRNLLPEAYIANPLAFTNHIFAVDILADSWPVTSKFPAGDSLRSVGQAGSIQSETEALLVENGLYSAVFPTQVTSSLREYIDGGSATAFSTLPPPPSSAPGEDSPSGWQIPPDEIARRLDLRSTCIFTIDPSGAKDLDDALHITPLGGDLFEVGVHIADVSYFVRPGTPVDEEAAKRATSVYLVQKVIPMLPPVLCEELCSLNPNVDRLAYSCIWKMKRDGTLLEDSPPQVVKTVIRSCAKMDYITAQRIIDGRIPASCSDTAEEIPEELWETRRRPVGHAASTVVRTVLMFNEVAQNRRALRMTNGALVLNKTKLSFRLDLNGNPSALSAYPIYDSNRLVEEYMLLANYLVAQELLVRVGNLAFIRNHPPPELKSIDVLSGVAGMLGVSLDTSSSAGMQASLSRLTEACGSNVAMQQAVTALLMKPMQLAQYIVAGKVKSEQWRHFALCIPYYTHFTSPIRRYADVMVHRLLHEGVGSAPDSDDSNCDSGSDASAVCDASGASREARLMESYHGVAEHCNKMKKASKDAQERSDVVFFAVYLMAQPGGALATDGVVIGVGEKTFTVLVNDAYGGSQARMFVDEMDEVTSSFNNDTKVLTLIKEEGSSGSGVPAAGGLAGRELCFTTMTIELMTRVRVLLSAKQSVPIDVKVSLVGPI